jgi:hypothetical protein
MSDHPTDPVNPEAPAPPHTPELPGLDKEVELPEDGPAADEAVAEPPD